MTTPRGTRRVNAPVRPTGNWRGTVSKVDGSRLFVTIPRLSPGRQYGPVEVGDGPWTSTTGPGGSDGHTHPSGTPLAVGDRVLVGFVEGNVDDVVVITRLR